MLRVQKIEINKIKVVDYDFNNLSIEEFDRLLKECGIDDIPSKESDLLNQVYKSFEKEV